MIETIISKLRYISKYSMSKSFNKNCDWKTIASRKYKSIAKSDYGITSRL